MKKRKIPKWLGKAGAIIGIVAVIVSSLVLPVSAGMSTNDLTFDTYTQEYQISSIQMYLFESDNSYRYTDLKNCYVAFTPTGIFPLSSTADGTYTRYDPQCFKAPGSTIYYPATGLLNTSGSMKQVAIGDHTRYERDVRNFFIFSTDGNGLASTSFSTDSIEIRFDDIYIPAGRYNFFGDESQYPSILLNCFSGYESNIYVEFSFEYEYYDSNFDLVVGKMSSYSPDTYNLVDSSSGLWGVSDTSESKTIIPIFQNGMFYETAAYYKDNIKDLSHSAYHFTDFVLTIRAEPGTKFSTVGIQYNMPFVLGADNQDIFYSDYEEYVQVIEKEVIVYKTITADADFSSWIVTAVGSFFDFQIFPGLNIGSVLFFTVGLGILVYFLKLFA